VEDATVIVTNCSFTGSIGAALYISTASEVANATLINCIFTDNVFWAEGGRTVAGGAIYSEGSTPITTLEGCKFVVPANTSLGNNDLFGTVTFTCPPGTKGTPVAVPAGSHTAEQLPPSTEIVHCT
jgi:hypothetical protein